MPALSSLLEHVHVRVADDLTAKYPAAWPARVTLTLANGSQLCEASDYPRGNPENPIDRRELEQKFRALVEPRFGPAGAEQMLAAVAQLAASQDIEQVFAASVENR